jgi:hypothetical protein
LLRINNRTHTSKGHKAYSKGPSSSNRQPSVASDPVYNERDQAGLAIECDDSSLQRESETKRFGPTAREPSVDSTPLVRLKLEGKNLKSGRSNKRNRTSCSCMHNVSLHRCIGRREASSSCSSPEGRDLNLYRLIRDDRVDQNLLCASSRASSYRYDTRIRRSAPPIDINRTVLRQLAGFTGCTVRRGIRVEENASIQNLRSDS